MRTDSLQGHYAHKVYHNTGNSALLALVPPHARTALDIGCGAGDNARLLRQRGIHVTGITISEAEAITASDTCHELHIADIEGEIACLDQRQFDVIILSHVLEHLVRPEQVLKRLASKLANDGQVLIAVPNMAFWRWRLQLLRGVWTRTETGPFDKTHLHFWSFDTAVGLLTGTNLVATCHIPGDSACPLWPFRRILPRLCKHIDRWAGARFPNLFAMQTLLVCRPLPFVGKAHLGN
jgi:methionine biosynthesis protein MetW